MAVLSDINISYPYAKLFIDKNRNFNAIDIIKSNKKSAARSENNFDFTLKNIKLLGDKVRLAVLDDEKSQEMAYLSLGVGLGEMNSRGAGFVNYRWL